MWSLLLEVVLLPPLVDIVDNCQETKCLRQGDVDSDVKYVKSVENKLENVLHMNDTDICEHCSGKQMEQLALICFVKKPRLELN